jgi:threonine dehydrogenase-like Zn-dependent dehydrogenase
VPDELKSEWASAASCALRTIVNVFEKAGKIDHMDPVVIQGAGPLGLFATAMASVHSPRELIVIGAPEARLAIARQWGATQTISIDEYPNAADRLARVREITDGAGAAVVMELSGGRTAFGEGVEMVAEGGRYIMAGTVGGDPQPVRANLITNRELNVHGVFGADIDAYHKALEFMRHHRERFDWDLMLGNRYQLDELTLALQKMQAFEDIKPVVVTH